MARQGKAWSGVAWHGMVWYLRKRPQEPLQASPRRNLDPGTSGDQDWSARPAAVGSSLSWEAVFRQARTPELLRGLGSRIRTRLERASEGYVCMYVCNVM